MKPPTSKAGSSAARSLMLDIARHIEAHSEDSITLKKLSVQAQLSPQHLQRRFKAELGVSPKEYHDFCRRKKLKSGLKEHSSVTHAIYDAGFGSSSRVYEGLDKKMGMTPKQYRVQGQGLTISYANSRTPLGETLIGATDRGICFLQFGASKRNLVDQLRKEFPKAMISEMKPKSSDQFHFWMKALSSYLEGQQLVLDLPLDISGTVFQIKVWKYLQNIPAGAVSTYAQVAQAIGKPKAIRAVASACAKNSVAIVIPCHRVLRGDGKLAGYRWGLERKRQLLNLERNAVDPSSGK